MANYPRGEKPTPRRESLTLPDSGALPRTASRGEPLAAVARFDQPSFVMDPYHAYGRLRREAPVWWCEAAQAWAITRYTDVRAVLTDPDSFSSEPRVALVDPGDSDAGGESPYADPDTAMLIVTDPPRHHSARRMFTATGAYSRAATEQRRDEFRELCETMIRRLPAGHLDLVEDVALPAAVELFQRFFDLPDPRTDEPRWQDALLVFYAPGTGATTQGLLRYMKRVVAVRRATRGADPISAAVSANTRERLLRDDQMAWNLYDAVLAGGASTVAVIAESLAALASRPEAQRDELWADPEAVTRAVDELLRWVNHIHFVKRTASSDVEISGQRIRRGDAVYAVVASANRDEEVWERGEELDLHRRAVKGHFAFGYGPHVATGSMLVRTFLSTLLPAFLAARAPFVPSGEAQYSTSIGHRTPLRIPIAPA